MSYTPEPIPSAIVASFLGDNWQTYSNRIPKPKIIDINDGTTPPGMADLARTTTDYVTINMGVPGEQETYRDSWKYLDRANKIELRVYTKVSRQRLYDLKAEIRRIIHYQMHRTTSYQVVVYVGFDEMVNEQQGIWEGMITLRLENNRLLMET